jgi:hypothetical protein
MHTESLSTLFKKLYSVTETLLENFSDENVIETIECRGELLNKINHLQNDSTKVDPETRAVMAKIIDLDKVLAKKVNGRMNVIKSEINGLYSKSRAAVAYASNKK